MVKKISLVIFGILLVLLFELSLCAAGRIFLFARGIEDLFLQHKKFTKTICCVGDSHTFGVGAAYKYSYPKQLETLLNLNNPKLTFKVVNLGVPGLSTRQQVEKLGNFLNKNRVDIVIFLTGANNYYEVKAWGNKSFLVGTVIKIKKMRIYRVMQYVLWRFLKMGEGENINALPEKAKYENYMEYHLGRAKSLCKQNGSKLLFISYFYHPREVIEKFAMRSGLLHFDLSSDFSAIIPKDKLSDFISRDGSHLNFYGYNVFAELLYKQMFLHREALNLELNPLVKKIAADSFPKKTEISYLRYLLDRSVFYEN